MKRSIDDDDDDRDENSLWKRISLKCLDKFDELGPRGKPSTNEWTHLAAFVALDEQSNDFQILSIGTGTKCLGREIDQRGMNGCLLHDSHAEVIAKRSLQRLFYEYLISKDQSLLQCLHPETNQYQLRDSLKIYLFVSYPPCGLAASMDDPIKRPKLEHKLIPPSSSDSDVLILKPGKGSPTSSLSCTNKINRWIYQGLEGRLLNQIIRSPIRLSGLILFSSKDLSSVFPSIDVFSLNGSFSFGPSKERIRPSSMSIAWWKTLDVTKALVTVDGYPLGQIRRLHHQPDYANPLAKISFLRLYLRLIKDSPIENPTYAQAKSFSSNSLRDQFIKDHPHWLVTDPEIFYSFHSH